MSKHHKPSLTAAELHELTLQDGVLFHTGKGRPVALPQASAPLADTHGHLTHFRQHHAAQALARAAAAGVRLLVVPLDPTDDARDAHATLAWLAEQEAQAAEELARLVAAGACEASTQLPDLRIVAGTHPYGAPELDAAALHQLDLLLDDPRCVGVGEFGLDFGPWNEAPADAQLQAMRTQLRIAHDRCLPVELHLRDEPEGDAHTGHALALKLLQEEGVPEAGCDLHCFTHDPAIMRPFTELGCHIAFGGAATFNASDEVRAAAAQCPAQLLLSETDSPYMAPVPLRGQECEPAMVAFAAATVAGARAMAGIAPAHSTYQALWDNAQAFFGLTTVPSGPGHAQGAHA